MAEAAETGVADKEAEANTEEARSKAEALNAAEARNTAEARSKAEALNAAEARNTAEAPSTPAWVVSTADPAALNKAQWVASMEARAAHTRVDPETAKDSVGPKAQAPVSKAALASGVRAAKTADSAAGSRALRADGKVSVELKAEAQASRRVRASGAKRARTAAAIVPV